MHQQYFGEPRTPFRDPHRGGFSALELPAVIGIIAVLIAILLPVLSRVRSVARSTRCLSNLQQWGQAYQTYLTSNRGASPPLVNPLSPSRLEWWESLEPHGGEAILLCPEASEARPPDPAHWNAEGTAHFAWHLDFDHLNYGGAPRHGDFRGSYGWNHWVCTVPDAVRAQHHEFIHFPVRNPERIPLLGDCCEPLAAPNDGDPAPSNFDDPAPGVSAGLAEYCINRHHMAINLAFLDGHAERVPLGALWQLKWSETFQPRHVIIPGSD